MLRTLFGKLREAFVSVLPVALLVVLINFTPLVDFSAREITVFLLSSVFLILGIALFNLGADMAMTPMGEHVGAGLSRSGRLLPLFAVCLLMGIAVTVAEPDLSVLAAQVSGLIDGTVLIVLIGVGVGIFVVVSIAKIVFQKDLSSILMYFYMVLFALVALVAMRGNKAFLALAFDSGGVTTGPITVPFLMALGVGIASTLGGKRAGENSFGTIAMCSIGPVLAVMAIGIFAKGDVPYVLPDYSLESHLGQALPATILSVAKEVALALGMIVLFFFVLQIFCLKLPRKKLCRIVIGILYTFVGLVVFLAAVTVGFMPIGFKLGTELAGGSPPVLIGFAFVLGAVVVLAEPAVYVLNHQVAEITGGAVSRRSMMIALSVGVGVSIGLSLLRTCFGFNLLYYLIPGYLISFALSFFVPGIYTAIAFDSGGVASGPLTSSFILPFAVGACCVLQGEANVMTDAFGVVAMVAMTPLITIQLLGFRAVVSGRIREKLAMKHILNADDEQIIGFAWGDDE